MNTVRRLIYGEVLWAILFVTLAFLSLFVFFDVVDELGALGRKSLLDPQREYGLLQALTYVGLLLPNRLYELIPITVLIGSVYGLVRLAQSSEFTILRTSGLGPAKALRTLLTLGLGFTLLTIAIGDYVAPVADRTAQLLKAEYRGQISVGQTGAWLKERSGDTQSSVNIKSMDANGALQGIRVFEFNNEGLIKSTLDAKSATIETAGWRLHSVTVNRFAPGRVDGPQTSREQLDELLWPSTITADMIAVTLLRPDRMKTLDLFEYVQHLDSNNQESLRYEIEFWRKVFYPLSCLVMVVLALPFAYLHFRAKGTAGYVFAGVMIGISFFLLNNVFGYIGNLRAWEPWVAAAAPGLLYSMVSLGAFGWLVFKR
jgi:lipopolysaccharide export system permease protein